MLQIGAWHILQTCPILVWHLSHDVTGSNFVLRSLNIYLSLFKLFWMTGGILSWMGFDYEKWIIIVVFHSDSTHFVWLCEAREAWEEKAVRNSDGRWLSWQILFALVWFASELLWMLQGQIYSLQKYTKGRRNKYSITSVQRMKKEIQVQ